MGGSFRMISIFLMMVFFVVLGTCTTVFLGQSQKREHFETDPEYKARMSVMKVFDLVDQRSPTMDEIVKYSAFKNEQDIMLALTNDKIGRAKASHVTDEAVTPNVSVDFAQAVANSVGIIEAQVVIMKNLFGKV